MGSGCSIYTKPRLLIVDELGYLPFETNWAHLFFELVSRRYERGSVFLSQRGQVPVSLTTQTGRDLKARFTRWECPPAALAYPPASAALP